MEQEGAHSKRKLEAEAYHDLLYVNKVRISNKLAERMKWFAKSTKFVRL